MKSNLFFLLFFVVTISLVNAQSKHNHRDFDIASFNKQKTDYIISKVGLTSKEAAEFIPLMTEFQQKRFELNRDVRIQSRKLKKNTNATDNDYQQFIELSIESNLKEAQLNKEYYQKFKSILSAKQIYEYQLAESDFMKSFIKQRQDRNNKK